MGMTVADTRAEKLHPLTENCWAAGAGTSADLQHMARSCHHTFRLLQLQQEYTIGNPHRRHLSPRGWRERTSGTTNKDIQQLLSTPQFPSMTSICHWLREELYNQGGACQANLIVGGICPKSKAPFLRAIHPHGSMDEVAFAALGSGGLAAMAVLESSLANAHWKRETQSQNSTASSDPTLPLQDAISILLRAVRAGIENDLGSGSQIDLVIMHKNGTTTYQRAAVPEAELPPIVSENDDASAESTTSSLTLPETNDGLGVNGFGNTPFVLRPSLFGQRSIPKRQEEVEREWNDLLGLNC
uniref:Proteasome endopeptidase complex n=1 Tax=Entomoneis paludosa TaxID=265537 RepID=A0A7S2Y7Q8_9STRA